MNFFIFLLWPVSLIILKRVRKVKGLGGVLYIIVGLVVWLFGDFGGFGYFGDFGDLAFCFLARLEIFKIFYRDDPC